MKLCSYYGCGEPVTSDEFEGFTFCLDHLAYLHRMIELDSVEIDERNTIAYCLAALNSKAYNRQEVIL